MLNQIEYSLALLRWQCTLVSQLTLHLVSSEFSRGDLTLLVENRAFSLTAVVTPLSIIDRIVACLVVPSTARSLTIDEVSYIDITRLRVLHPARLILPI